MSALQTTDPEIYQLVKDEEARQKDVLEMIPSENYASRAVIEALGTVLNNKYSEGYPKKRYYQGNRVVDEVETLAEERAKKLFGVPYVNVQALSGSPANLAVYFALLEPLKDKILGFSLRFGGHLTHGASGNISSRFFKAVQYESGKDGYLDYEAVEKIALQEKPKILVSGGTAYPRIYDFAKFGQIADKVGAYHLADVSHVAGLIAAGAYPDPAPHAHIITTTTHKTLRGPRGALIMVTDKGLQKNPDLPKLIDSAIIPGIQGGPHDNQTAAIAVALLEASQPEFKEYGAQVIKNNQVLAEEMLKSGFDLVSGGTESNLILIDLTNKKINGAAAAFALEVAGIVTNKNGVPFDPMPPFYPSGLRLGSPAITTRGMKEKEMARIAQWINEVIEEVKGQELPADKEERSVFWKNFKESASNNKKLQSIFNEVKTLTSQFPVP